MKEHLCKKNGTQQQELSKPSQTSSLDNNEFYISICGFPIHTIRDARVQNFMSQKIEARGAKRPFMVLSSIRGMRPHNPARLMRQLGRTQTTPVQGDTNSFVIDYNGCIKIPFAKTILQKWAGRVNLKVSIAENRYEAGYVDEYKTWFQDDLRGVVNLTPRVGREIEDVQINLQIHTYHFQQKWYRMDQ